MRSYRMNREAKEAKVPESRKIWLLNVQSNHENLLFSQENCRYLQNLFVGFNFVIQRKNADLLGKKQGHIRNTFVMEEL